MFFILLLPEVIVSFCFLNNFQNPLTYELKALDSYKFEKKNQLLLFKFYKSVKNSNFTNPLKLSSLLEIFYYNLTLKYL